jgi:hypothetical protein
MLERLAGRYTHNVFAAVPGLFGRHFGVGNRAAPNPLRFKSQENSSDRTGGENTRPIQGTFAGCGAVDDTRRLVLTEI